jgi:uncharacterized protein YcfJ
MGIVYGLNKIGGKTGTAELSGERTEYGTAVADRVQPSRDATLRLIEELKLKSQGGGPPSLAEKNLVSANQRSLAQTLSAASAMRGVPQGATQRQVQRQRGMAQRNLKEQGGMLQLQEQAAAQDQLASLALAQQQESLQQVMQPGGVSAQAASTRFAEDVKREEEQRKKYGREVGAAVGAVGTVAGGIVGGIYGGPAGAAAGAAGGGALGSAVGQGAGEAMSDKRLKKHVETAKSDVKKFLDSVGAKKYEYKDPKAPGAAKGERVGVMAQDLEKSEMGKALVRNTPQGKMVDTVQGFGALLAAQAEMHNRLKKLEKGKK